MRVRKGVRLPQSRMFLSVRRAVSQRTRTGKRRLKRIKLFGSRFVKRGRGIQTLNAMTTALEFNLNSFFREGNKTVLEIGTGHGNLLSELKKRFPGKISKAIGLDLAKAVSSEASEKIDELIIGDALSARFPKADAIFSIFTLGYVGHPDFMLKKIEESLNPRGIAILDFNSRIANYSSKSGQVERNIQWGSFFEKLKKAKRFGNSKVLVVNPDEVFTRFKEGGTNLLFKMGLSKTTDDYYALNSILEKLSDSFGSYYVLLRKS